MRVRVMDAHLRQFLRFLEGYRGVDMALDGHAHHMDHVGHALVVIVVQDRRIEHVSLFGQGFRIPGLVEGVDGPAGHQLL